MANVTQIEINGVDYNICDAQARDDIANLQESVNKAGDITRYSDVTGVWFVGYTDSDDMSLIFKLKNGGGLELNLVANGSKLYFRRRPNWATATGATTLFTK